MKTSKIQMSLIGAMAVAAVAVCMPTQEACAQVEPTLAEIRIVAFNFAPRGWAQCDGQILSIEQNEAMFSLLGNTYGGDGRTSFALPDLRGRVPVHPTGSGSGIPGVTLGQSAGGETAAASVSEIPSHSHNVTLQATSDVATQVTPAGNRYANGNLNNFYRTPGNTTFMAASLGNTGSAVGHENMQPFLTVNYIIALQGTFPARN